VAVYFFFSKKEGVGHTGRGVENKEIVGYDVKSNARLKYCGVCNKL
jgi:hypothetical protein